jgi:23S rRNA (uracil1939-C5)-methyltransferase
MSQIKQSQDVTITDLDHEGRGVGRCADGKTIFVEEALPGESVRVTIQTEKPSFRIGRLERIISPSSQRVTPKCPHFSLCGGCSLQHLEANSQVIMKQRALEEALERLGNVHPDQILSPLYGSAWGYRTRARLSVNYLAKQDRMLIGFRKKHSSHIASLNECHVLPPSVSSLLTPLAHLLHGFSIRDRIPQIEVAVPTAPGANRIILVLRILESLTAQDQAALQRFADIHPVQWWLQTKGPDTVKPFYPLSSKLAYSLPDFDLEYDFYPTEFTQVNAGINQAMVRRAIQLLAPQPDEHLIDFFCGLGNFTLPIARQGAYVLGLEGSPALVKRAQHNAQSQQLDTYARFDCMNLFEIEPEKLSAWGTPDGALLDPPRDGALELAKALPSKGYSRLVYISCNPATLARDASILVHTQGYRLEAAGVMNMFPHTTHTESMAVFRR